MQAVHAIALDLDGHPAELKRQSPHPKDEQILAILEAMLPHSTTDCAATRMHKLRRSSFACSQVTANRRQSHTGQS